MKTSSMRYFVFLSLFLIFVVLIIINAFSHVRLTLSDSLQGENIPQESIVIIEIDDQSIQEIGRWPWNRDVFAHILNNLEGARVIGLDVSFFEASPSDEQLRNTLESMDNVVLASEINDGILYRPIFQANTGYVNLITDNDGVTRKVSLIKDAPLLPFSFLLHNKGLNTNKQFEEGLYHINFINKPHSFESYTASEVLNGQIDVSNSFVLIGATAPNLHDTYFVPTSKGKAMPGVEVHATILQNVLEDTFVNHQSKAGMIFAVFISALLSLFLFSRMKIYYAIPLMIAVIAIYAYLAILLFSSVQYALDLFFFPVSLLVFTGAGIGINYLQEKKDKEFIKGAFGKYISQDLLNHIIERKHELKLGGEKRVITVFFSDIRNFTTISEKLSPQRLVSLINKYLTEMTDIILELGGTVDKFIGDAILAFWNAPLKEKDHALLACKGAILQIKATERLAKKFPGLSIGCGLNTGEAVIGNMGSDKRFDYTAMGDTVNLASRLEGLTKHYGVKILLSEYTYKKVKGSMQCRLLDKVKVKGKKLPVSIYELCTDNSDKNKQFVDKYEKAFNLYLKKEFKTALKEFEKALKIKKDKAAEMMAQRCKEYSKNPPKRWDGSFTMTSK